MEFFFANIFPFIFILTGSAIIIYSIHLMVQGAASKKWPTCGGRVIASGITSKTSTDSNTDDDGFSHSTTTTSYYPEVLYEFKVADTLYNGNDISINMQGSNSPTHARRTANKYPKNSLITVYYKPDNPEKCLLEPGMSGWTLFGVLFGSIFLGAGLLLYFGLSPLLALI